MSTTEDLPGVPNPFDPLDADALDDAHGLAAVPANGSVLERLRAQRAADLTDHLDVVLPLWDGDLQVVARLLRIPWRGRVAESFDKLVQTAGRRGKTAGRELDAMMDLLIAGLDQLYVRDGQEAPLEPLGDVIGDGTPMRFDLVTAQALELPATRVREVVYEMFGGERGEFRLRRAGEDYFSWLRDVDVVSDDEGKD